MAGLENETEEVMVVGVGDRVVVAGNPVDNERTEG